MSNPPSQPEWKPGQPPPWDQPGYGQQPQQPPSPEPGWAQGAPPPGVPYTPMPQAAPPPKKSLLSRFLPLIVLIVVVGVIAGGYYLFRDQLSGSVTELATGDCFDEPAGTSTVSSEVKDIQHRPCTQPHDAEVFFVVNNPAAQNAAYPTRDERQQFVADRCVPAFQSYTGRSFESAAELDLAWFYPTSDGWTSKNDREFTCYTKKLDGSKLTSSVKAAAPPSQ